MEQQHRIPQGIILLALLGMLVISNASAWAAATPNFPDQRQAASSAVTWLMRQNQNEDGGFGTFGPSSDVSGTLDAILGISAAGYNADALYFGKDRSAIDFLRDNSADLDSFGNFDGGSAAKIVLALLAANQDPRDFQGADYVVTLKDHYDLATGSYNNPAQLNPFKQSLSILALQAAGEAVPANAITWLEAGQAVDGSWDDGFGTLSNPDATAVAIMALVAAGIEPTDAVVADALAFLAASQLDSGGWEYSAVPGGESANSTAFVIQALAAVDEDFYSSDGAWAQDGVAPLTALLMWQNTNGAFQADFGDGRFDSAYATVQTIPAVVGRPFPLPSRYDAAQKALLCLAGLQDEITGQWEQFAGAGLNAGGTSRAIEAISAAGGDPQSSAWTPGVINAVEALENGTDSYLAGQKGGRAGVVTQGVVAAGPPYDAANFADKDLPAVIAGYLAENGAYDDTGFGIQAHAEAMLGLLAAREPVDPTAVQLLLDLQSDGGWSSPDGTGIALNVLGRLGKVSSLGLENLRSTQLADGGWGFDGSPSNPNSTSEAAQGLVQQGENPFAPEWSQIVDGRVVNAADVIMAQQEDDGCWPNWDGSLDDPFGATDAILLFSLDPAFKHYSVLLPVVRQ